MNDHLALLFETRPRALAALCTLWLAACGGGGDAGTAQAPATSGTTAPPAAAPAAPSGNPPPATPAAGSTCGLPDFAATALARINQLRAAGASCRGAGNFAAAGALSWSAPLTQAAEVHSQDMVGKNFFSHTGSAGSSLADRVNATGYAWSSLGENIAAGYANVDSVLNGWMASDGHCANIMNPAFNQVGLVCVTGSAANSYNTYWTLDLARSR